MNIGLATLAFLLVGCLEERRYGVEDGGACNANAECAPGLVCVGKLCVPGDRIDRDGGTGRFVPGRDVDPPDADPDVPRPRDTGSDTVDPPPDVPSDTGPEPICTPGERDCATNFTVRICNLAGDGFDSESCADGTWCQGGACVPREECEDRDGDGFRAGPDCQGQTDCNDDNATVFPAAREDCTDFLDNNCDGVVDEGAFTLYRDADNDRFGDPRQTRRWCEGDPAPSGWVRNGRDCDDGDPRINPSAEERCNELDDNCNRQVDEGGVCANCSDGTCPRGSICVDGECRETPPDSCEFQNQPCNPGRGADSEEFACVSFAENENDEGICFGLCDYREEDADDTCPDPNSICAFQVDDDLGFCLRSCDPVTNTGCFEGQGCVAIGRGGGCIPAGDEEEGERCNDFNGPFADCAPGLACIDVGFGPECLRLCNPLREVNGLGRICSGGQACRPFTPDFAFCQESVDRDEGASCRRFEAGQPCGDDLLCIPVRRGQTECARVCRLGRDEDCINGGRCRFSEFLDESEGLGICR